MTTAETHQLLVESLDDIAIYLVDAAGNIATWNRGAEHLTHYVSAGVIGKSASRLYPTPQQAEALAKAREHCAATRETSRLDGELLREDGSVVPVTMTIQSLYDTPGKLIGFAETARDLTRRNAASEAHKFTEEHFRRLVQGVVDYAIYMLDLKGHVHSWNAGAARIKGFSADEIIGQHYSLFYTEEDQKKGEPQRGLETARELGRFENRAWRVRKDGSLFWAHIVIDRIDDDEGNPLGFAKITRDATESRKAEETLDEMRRALHQSQKMEAIGQLTGGVAHDFNNLLQVISGNLQLVNDDVAQNEQAKRRIANAMAGVSRGSKLASQLLAFGRRQPLAPRVVNPGKLLRGMDDLLRHTLGEEIEIETVISGGLWNSLIDRANLENAILNLAINARDAIGGRGRLTIEAGNAYLDDQYSRRHHEVKAGQYVIIAVTDTGCGIPPELMEKVFDPFFSTKAEGSGTGLGLSMVYGFVKQSEGHVKIYSEVGHGTTVKIYLPRSAENEVQTVESQKEPMRGGSETILVVEDDEGVRETAVALLLKLGYTVLQASDAHNALSVIESGVELDLLFTDVIMPGPMRSPELARIARQRLPNLSVLFTSGYTQNAIVHGGRLDDGVDLLTKPYTQEAMAQKIREVLSARIRSPSSGSHATSGGSSSVVVLTMTRPRVLLCEDDASIRMTVGDLLESKGYDVIEAASAEDAIHQFGSSEVDILVTDLNLPGASGQDLAHALRHTKPELPVVFTTGHHVGVPPLNSRCEVVLKPFGVDELVNAISSLMADENRSRRSVPS